MQIEIRDAELRCLVYALESTDKLVAPEARQILARFLGLESQALRDQPTLEDIPDLDEKPQEYGGGAFIVSPDGTGNTWGFEVTTADGQGADGSGFATRVGAEAAAKRVIDKQFPGGEAKSVVREVIEHLQTRTSRIRVSGVPDTPLGLLRATHTVLTSEGIGVREYEVEIIELVQRIQRVLDDAEEEAQ